MKFIRKLIYTLIVSNILLTHAMPMGQVANFTANTAPVVQQPVLMNSTASNLAIPYQNSINNYAIETSSPNFKLLAANFGNKYTNLVKLQEMSQNDKQLQQKLTKMGGYSVSIPEFTGLSSNQIKSLLSDNNLSVVEKWDQIIESSINEEVMQETFKSKTFPAQFLENTEKLAQKITDTFETLAQKAENEINKNNKSWLPWRHRKTTSSFLDKETEQFIKLANKNGWKLIVRSTGKEDTKELANAGGNHSELGVEASIPGILRATGKVVASYLKEKSLNQRLQAGDKTVFDSPFTPVLIQRMIGENIGGGKKIS